MIELLIGCDPPVEVECVGARKRRRRKMHVTRINFNGFRYVHEFHAIL